MENQTLSNKAVELLPVFEALAIKHGVNVEVNPEHYKLRSPAAIDVEHDEQGNLVGIGVFDGSRSLYFTRVDQLLRTVLSNLDFIAHNGKGDFDSLRSWGIPLSDDNLIWDTMLMGHILDSSLKSYGLKDMAKRELGIEYPDYAEIVGKHKGKSTKAPNCPQTEVGCCGRVTLDKQPVKLVALYNAFDCYCTYKLYEKQSSRPMRSKSFKDSSVEEIYFDSIEKPASLVFANMENRGTRIDVPYLKNLKETLEKQAKPLKDRILNELGPINLNSSKQLLEALHAKQIQPTLKGKASADKRALERFKSSPIVQSLLQYSEFETLLSGFVSPYLERNTAVVHPFFNQCGTRTGRPSCSNPNLLQIPKRTENGRMVRRMFIPREGMVMFDSDYKQIEPKMLATLSKDKAMLQLFNDGVDFHTYFATRLNITRDSAKVFDLETYYRATKYGVARHLKCSEDQAQKEINKAWELFPELRRWEEKLIFDTKRSGYCTTLLGRRIKIDGLDSNNNWRRETAERQLMNNIAQGSAAEVMKLGMIRLHNDRRLSPSFGLLIQVYDALTGETPDIENDGPLVIEGMEKAIQLDVPLTVDFKAGPNWADVKEVSHGDR